MVKTKFPFFDFYFQIMNVLLNSIKLERVRMYPKYESEGNFEGFLKKFDSRLITQIFGDSISKFLTTFAAAKCPMFEKSLTVNWGGIQFSLSVPKPALAEQFEGRFGMSMVCRHFSWSNYITVFAAVLQEKHIIFVSESRETLSKLILFFTSIIRPFLWHFPLIYFLDRSHYEILDSIVPLIVGVDRSKKEFKQFFNLSKVSNMYLVYFVEDDVLEVTGDRIEVPNFDGKLEKLERRYKKIQKNFSTTSSIGMNREALVSDFLSKTKSLIETNFTEIFKDPETLKLSLGEIKDLAKKKAPWDAKFLDKFCCTQTFSVFIDRAKEMRQVEVENKPSE